MKSLPPQVEIIIFYIIVLHLHCFTQHKTNLQDFTFTLSVNKFHYGIYTYTKWFHLYLHIDQDEKIF
jgi:hypothetical protein